MRREKTRSRDDEAIVRESRVLGVAVITVVLILVVLNSIMTLGIIAGSTTTVENESITVDYDNVTSVDEDGHSYSDTVTIFNSSDVELAGGTDYEWFSSNGSVNWINTTATTDGETASITYNVTQGGATGPYASLLRTDIPGISAAAFAVMVIGFIVISANAVLNYFGRGL